MSVSNAFEKRRSVYALNKELPVSEDDVIAHVARDVELVPDAFNMRSARVVVALGKRQDELWDAIYDAFGGKVAREKIDSFKAGAGTVLFFIDRSVVEALQGQFPSYADNFPVWSEQANGMLQFAVWSDLAELGVGANLQHYNPVIDDAVRALFDVPESYVLRAEMVFGGIVEPPADKEGENVASRFSVAR